MYHNHSAKDRAAIKKAMTKKVVGKTFKAKLGTGARFKAVAKSAAASGARNPAAVAAAAGRAKYGNAKMQKMAAAGRKKK